LYAAPRVAVGVRASMVIRFTINSKNMKSKKIVINKGDKVNTKDGIGVVEKIVPGQFPFFVRLENGGTAWQGPMHIISVIRE
jgi:hypothetical protein